MGGGKQNEKISKIENDGVEEKEKVYGVIRSTSGVKGVKEEAPIPCGRHLGVLGTFYLLKLLGLGFHLLLERGERLPELHRLFVLGQHLLLDLPLFPSLKGIVSVSFPLIQPEVGWNVLQHESCI